MKYEVNNIASDLISRSKRKDMVREINRNVDFFDGVYGVMTEDIALSLIKQGITSRKIESLLPNLFYFCDQDTVSNEVFQMILRLPNRKIRSSVLISIAHCPISVYQLQYICSLHICFEAFATLLAMYLLEECFTHVDLAHLLEQNSCYLRCIDRDSLSQCCAYDSRKRTVLNSFLQIS